MKKLIFRLFVLRLFFRVIQSFLNVEFFFLHFFFFRVHIYFCFLFIISKSHAKTLPSWCFCQKTLQR